MKAVVITRPGSPNVLQVREVPEPSCGPGQVRVRVRAAGLNRADLLQRRGLYPAPPGSPAEIPGLEFAGVVEEASPGPDGLIAGERVMGILGGGGHAEVVCVDAGLCVRIPDNLSWEEAGAVPEAFATAFDALFLQAGLTKRETLLVQAAASGVGTAAASLALALGAKVIGGSRSADKRLRLSDLGLTHVFDPAEDGLEETLRRAAGADGIDVALDLVGAPAVPLELEVLGDGGRIVVIGLLGGAHALVDLAVVMRKRLRLSGSVLRGRPLEQKIELTRAWDRHVSPLLASGRVAPIVDRSFPLERAAEAHAYMEGNRNFGKIVLNIG